MGFGFLVIKDCQNFSLSTGFEQTRLHSIGTDATFSLKSFCQLYFFLSLLANLPAVLRYEFCGKKLVKKQ